MFRIGRTAVLALTLLLSLAAGFASAKDFSTKTIEITAIVGEKAELACQRYSAALPRFVGNDFEQRSLILGGAIRCQATHNRPVRLTAEFAPLTHVEAATPIGTAIKVNAPGYVEVGPGYELRGDSEGSIQLITGPWDTKYGSGPSGESYDKWEFADSGYLDLAGPTSRPIRIEVWGKLQRVFQQAAGDYETEIILTISD